MNPTKAEVDAMARRLLATVPERPRQRPFIVLPTPSIHPPDRLPPFVQPIPKLELGRLMDAAMQMAARRQGKRFYPDGCTCPRLPPSSGPQTYNLNCPDMGHRRLALAARHRKC